MALCLQGTAFHGAVEYLVDIFSVCMGVVDMQVCAFVYLRNIYSVVLQVFVVKMGHGKLLIKLGVC